MKKQVEFNVVSDLELPPMVISMNENDEPKVMLNTQHKIWLSLNRRLLVGIFEALPEKLDMILDGYLREQRLFEIDDNDMQRQINGDVDE
jgi:outer membrane PBP1 activator LpoA protein